MNIAFFSFLMLLIGACGESTTGPDEQDENISQEEFENLNRPCVDESAAITLPAVLADINNYSQFESTTLVNSVIQLSNSFRENLSMGLYPPENAISVTADGITIQANDTGYEWTVGGERYVYLVRNEGYQIYYYPEGNLSGREVIYVDQDANCDRFEYVQYAIEDEGEQEIGDIVFSYDYQKAGTAKIVEFGADKHLSTSESYRVRSFEDLSGEITIRTGGKVSQKLSWGADGNGNYQVLQDGTVVDEGSWSF